MGDDGQLSYHKIVPLKPFGKARPRVTKNGTFMPPEYTAQKKALRWHCHDMPDFSGMALVMSVVAHRPMPKSWSNKKRDQMRGQFTTAKPDIDNIVGAVMDALLVEDSNVVIVEASKQWSDVAGIEIRIYSVGDGIPF